MGTPLRVLIVEDSEDDALLVLRELRRGGYEPISARVDTPEAMAAELGRETWDIVISDYVLPRFTGLEALNVMLKKGLELPFIVTSGKADEETLVGAMKAGVNDYIMKNNLPRLVPAVERELREAAVRRERKKAEEALRESEELYRSLFENMLNGFAYCKMLFHQNKPQDFIYLNVNKSFEALTGLKNVIGKNVSEVIPGIRESDPKLFEIYGRVALSGRPERFEIYVEALGAWFWISLYSPRKEYFVAVFDVITERKRAEEALRESEKAAQKLAQENAVMAEIARVIGSTLKIEEVYERFAEEARKLIQFDCIAITVIKREDNTFIISYVAGPEVPGRERGKVIPLTGSGTEWVRLNRSSLLIMESNRKEIMGELPGLLPLFKAGSRSMMLLPLVSEDQVIGVLTLQTAAENAYTNTDLELAERVSAQIAGAIANVQLYIERERTAEALRRTEEAARRLAQETAVIAQIGQIVSSTLDIDVIYERFAREAKKLIEFDRITVGIIDRKENRVTVPYVWGTAIPGRQSADMIPLSGSLSEELFKTRSTLLIQTEDEKELATRFSTQLAIIQAGLRSTLFIPLFVQDEVIGNLSFFSKKSNAYADHDVKLAESIGYQVAGAIANAQLFLERKRAEEHLKASLKEKEVLFREVHHRVKNNLQVISSLLRLQSRYIRDDGVCRVLKESEDRVKTMAIIHEKLYQSTDLAGVDFAGYIRDLTANLYRSYGVSQEIISLRIHAKNVFLDINTAIPCGLIINELVSNCLKHAFPGGEKGEIYIGLSSDHNQIILTVGDNGGTFPKGLDFRNTESLGLQLVHSLIEQLEGAIEFHNDGKTEFRISFPAGHHK